MALTNTSSDFALTSNRALQSFQTDVSDHVLGWVKNSTSALNTTINALYDGLEADINTIFGNTPLKTIALGVVNVRLSEFCAIIAQLTIVLRVSVCLDLK